MKYLAKPFRPVDVTFQIICELERTPIESCFGPEDQIFIKKKLREGKIWAWCRIKVFASWADFVGGGILECASFVSEADFKNDPNYKRLKNIALSNLNHKVASSFDAIEFNLKT